MKKKDDGISAAVKESAGNDLQIYPGHGPASTMQEEKMRNSAADNEGI
jgi:hypothetical protein